MTTDMALTRPDPTMDEGSLRVMMALADRYVKSGLLPASIKTPQQALIIMGMGKELGVPATVALRQIAVVKGKPTCAAELMLALVHRTYGQSAMRVFKTDNESCTVQYRQAGWDGISEYTFTLEDAHRASLVGPGPWTQYPAAMLRARCISAVVRFAFPECIAGLYTPEEMGADVMVTDEGHVEIVGMPSDEYPNLTAQLEKAPDPASGPSCDKDAWNRTWHSTVKGTRFENEATRHKFIGWYTQSRTTSLSDFLDTASDGEAERLIEAITAQMEREAASQTARAQAAV